MTAMQEMIHFCAQDFLNEVYEVGFDNFRDMTRCYEWDASDIRGELKTLVESFGGRFESSTVFADIFDDEGMSYRAFKSAVLAEIKAMEG